MPIDNKLGAVSRRPDPIGHAYWRIDEEVHRYYEGIVKKHEDEGGTRKSLEWGSTAVALVALETLVRGPKLDNSDETSVGLNRTPLTKAVAIYAYSSMNPLLQRDVFSRLAGNPLDHDGTANSGDQRVVASHFLHGLWGLLRASRLPVLAVGCGALIGGATSAIRGLQEQDLDAISQGTYLIGIGISSIGTASSIYFRDQNPALLDRAPAWKRALGAVKNAIGTNVPTPAPIPVRKYRVTELDS